jgi:hypothetical protein
VSIAALWQSGSAGTADGTGSAIEPAFVSGKKKRNSPVRAATVTIDPRGERGLAEHVDDCCLHDTLR